MKNNITPKNLINNVLKFISGALMFRIVSFIIIPFQIRYLSAKGFGLADYYITTVTFFSIFFSFGSADGVVRFVSNDSINDKYLSSAFYLTLIGSILGIVFLYTLVPNEDIAYVSMFFCLTLFSSLLKASMRAKGFINMHLGLEILSAIALLSTFFLFIYRFQLSYKHVILSYAISLLVIIVLSILKLYQNKILLKRPSLKNMRELFLFSFPLIPNQLIWWFSMWLSRLQILNHCSAQDLASFALISKISSMITFIVNAASQGWYLAVYNSSDYKDEEIAFFKKTINFVLIGIGSGCIAMVFLAKLIIVFFSNDTYTTIDYLVPLSVLTAALNSLILLNNAFYYKEKKVKLVFVEAVIYMILISLIFVFFQEILNLEKIIVLNLLSIGILAVRRIYKTNKMIGKNLTNFRTMAIMVLVSVLIYGIKYF